MDINTFLQSRVFKIITLCVAIFIVMFFIFSLGVYVGTQKANFSFKWAEQYHNNFAGPVGGFFQEFEGKEFVESNGVFGKIIQVGDTSITVSGRDNAEKVISITDQTAIKYQREDIKISDLKVNEEVVVIGEPNDAGQIEAKLIRVMPAMPNIQELNQQVETNSI